MIIGNKSTFAFDVGQKRLETQMRTVDIVIDNRYVCCDDNTAFLPQFTASMERDKDRIVQNDWNKYRKYFEGKSITEIHKFILRTRTKGSKEYDIEDDCIYSLYSFLSWGPTTDNLFCFIIPWNDRHYLTYQFWRTEHHNKSEIGTVQNVQIELNEIEKTLEKAIAELKK